MPSRTSPSAGELDGVAEQVEQDLAHVAAVEHDAAGHVGRDRHARGTTPLRRAESATTCRRSVMSCARSVGTASMSMKPASIFDRSSTSLIRSSRWAPHFEIASSASRCVGVQRAIALQQLRVADHAVERRAQLVAHVGQELALGARRGFGRLLGPAQLIVALAPIRDVAQERAEEETRCRAASAR